MFAKPSNLLEKVVAVLMLWSSVTDAQTRYFAGGTGGPEDPYRIASAEQLVSIGSDPNLFDKHFILVDDISLDPNLPGGRVFTRPLICANRDDSLGFQGTGFIGRFDGNGHKISHLTIESATGFYAGLFGKIGTNGQVKDLELEDISILKARYMVGALAGINHGSVLRCRASGSVHAGAWPYIESLGGLVGFHTGRLVYSCATTNVYGDDQSKCLGGLAGTNWLGRIIGCYAASEVAGKDSLGGLVGNNYEGTITDCYATGSISSKEFSLHFGGLVGDNQAGAIANCYAASVLRNGSETWDWGGLLGQDSPLALTGDIIVRGAVANCFWDVEISNVRTSGGGTGLSTAQMRAQSSFTGWDFLRVWTISEGKDYPRLRWEQR